MHYHSKRTNQTGLVTSERSEDDIDMIYLHKILPALVSPLGLVSLLILLGIYKNKRQYYIAGLLILWIFSLPVVSNRLLGQLEKNYTLRNATEIPKHAAVVVLSGMVKAVKHGSEFEYEFTGAVDRIHAGIDLIKNKKANQLILTRGYLPWNKGMPEGEFLSKFAQKNGILKDTIALTSLVQNTEEEAKAVSTMLFSDKSVILVTSSFHMPRAQALFENQGLNVTPFPVDFSQDISRFSFLQLIPQSHALTDSSLFVREMIGRAYYAIKY